MAFKYRQVVLPDLACLRIAVYEESGRLLGHRVLPVTGLCPGYRHLSLRSDAGQPLNLSTLFVNIMVKGKLKIYSIGVVFVFNSFQMVLHVPNGYRIYFFTL